MVLAHALVKLGRMKCYFTGGYMESKDHWERVYTTKATDAVSWFQEHANKSLEIIRGIHLPKNAEIIDVGGGASVLVDELLSDGYTNITVLDLSAAALDAAKRRLGLQASQVNWIEADITTVKLPENHYDLWHDRAVFHFLNSETERAAYVKAVMKSVKPLGHVIVATFAEDGPTQCSGLPVSRYSSEELHAQFGRDFNLVNHSKEEHKTPFGTIQNFVYCYCRKESTA